MEKENRPLYTIREATIDDVEAIRTMHAQSWRDTYQNDDLDITEEWLKDETQNWLTPEALKHSKEFLSDFFNNTSHFYRVAFQDDEVVGLLHVSTNDDGTKRLSGLYVAKEAHGSGLAQQLMLLADQWIGDKEVDLEVASYNERAKAFYRKNGFIEVEGSNDLFKDKIPITRMIRKAGQT